MKKRILTIVAVLALAAVLVVSLVACIPSDPAKAKENLKEAGYTVMDVSLESIGLEIKGCTNIVTASKLTDLDDGITIFYFEDSAAASDAEEALIDFLGEDAGIKKQGKIIYAGSDEAIKAAK